MNIYIYIYIYIYADICAKITLFYANPVLVGFHHLDSHMHLIHSGDKGLDSSNLPVEGCDLVCVCVIPL